MASLSGNQFDQRGKKFAIKLATPFQIDPPPPIFLHDKIGEKFVAVSDEQMVKVARAAETVCADSINTPPLGKKNFQSGPDWHFRPE